MKFEPDEIEAFAARLAAARAATSMTREQLAGLVDGVSVQVLYNYEHGLRAPQRVETVVQLERALGLPVGALCRALGFAPLDRPLPAPSTEDVIAADPSLTRSSKDALLAAYRAHRAAR